MSERERERADLTQRAIREAVRDQLAEVQQNNAPWREQMQAASAQRGVEFRQLTDAVLDIGENQRKLLASFVEHVGLDGKAALSLDARLGELAGEIRVMREELIRREARMVRVEKQCDAHEVVIRSAERLASVTLVKALAHVGVAAALGYGLWHAFHP